MEHILISSFDILDSFRFHEPDQHYARDTMSDHRDRSAATVSEYKDILKRLTIDWIQL